MYVATWMKNLTKLYRVVNRIKNCVTLVHLNIIRMDTVATLVIIGTMISTPVKLSW